VILSGPHFEKALSIISQSLDLDELERITRFLGHDLQDIAPGKTKEQTIYKLLLWFDRRDCVSELFAKIAQANRIVETGLQAILDEAKQCTATAGAGASARTSDPLAPYFINKEPFIDRTSLDEKLTELWTVVKDGVLIVRGDRGCGRSHSWWRIRKSAEQATVSAHYIDLSKNPGSWTVSALIDRITVWLDMPVTSLKDRLAQESRLGMLFAAALGTHLRGFRTQQQRWCLVLDGLDRTGISNEIMELVQSLAEDILAGNLANFSLAFLGYGSTSHWNFEQLILDEDVPLLDRSHVKDFLGRVSKAVGKTIEPAVLDRITQEIFDGLELPCVGQTLGELKTRVKKHSVELMRRA
jgi:hypothetical protein